MALGVFLDLVDMTQYVLIESIQIEENLGGVTTASFKMHEPLFFARPGHPIILQDDDGSDRFVGKVIREERGLYEGRTVAYQSVNCVDLTTILDRRVVYKTYPPGTSYQSMVEDLCSNILVNWVGSIGSGNIASEGITADNVTIAGTSTELIQFPYVTARQFLDRVVTEASATTGDVYHWYFDRNGSLNAGVFSALPAPFTLFLDSSSDSQNFLSGTLMAGSTTEAYRNAAYIKSQLKLKEEPDSAVNAGARELQIDFRTTGQGQIKGVFLDSAPWRIVGGQRQFLPDGTFTWDGWRTITGTGASGETFYGIPALENVDYRDLPDEIALRAVGGDGAGLYETVTETPDVEDLVTSGKLIDGILAHQGSVPETIRFQTDEPGLQPGQMLTVDVPSLGLFADSDYIITAVSSASQVVPLTGGSYFRDSVTAVSVPTRVEGMTDFFSSFFNRTKPGKVTTQYDYTTIVIDTPDGTGLTGDELKSNPVVLPRPAEWIDVSIQYDFDTPPGDDLTVDLLLSGPEDTQATVFSGAVVTLPAGATRLTAYTEDGFARDPFRTLEGQMVVGVANGGTGTDKVSVIIRTRA
jgi:hypothetical protein